MAFLNTDGAAGTLAAMQATAHEPGDDEGAVDPFARDAALAAHARLDGHAADIAALKAHTGYEPDAEPAGGS